MSTDKPGGRGVQLHPQAHPPCEPAVSRVSGAVALFHGEIPTPLTPWTHRHATSGPRVPPVGCEHAE